MSALRPRLAVVAQTLIPIYVMFQIFGFIYTLCLVVKIRRSERSASRYKKVRQSEAGGLGDLDDSSSRFTRNQQYYNLSLNHAVNEHDESQPNVNNELK